MAGESLPPATVEIYDLAGRRVGREEVAAGGLGAEALSPGVYLYRVNGREQEKSGKTIISK